MFGQLISTSVSVICSAPYKPRKSYIASPSPACSLDVKCVSADQGVSPGRHLSIDTSMDNERFKLVDADIVQCVNARLR